MRRPLFALVLAIVSCAALGQEKPPWEWTLEERIARRLDPDHGTSRLLAHQSENLGDIPTPFIIEGAKNPELYLPGELMRDLLSTATPDGPPKTRIRESYRAGIEDFGWHPTTFWADVDSAGATYHELVAVTGDRSKQMSELVCAHRVAALKAMRLKYERFDEFLYRVVAIRSTLVWSESPTAEWLLWLEGGCQ